MKLSCSIAHTVYRLPQFAEATNRMFLPMKTIEQLLGERQMKIYLPPVALRLRSQGPAGGATGLRVNSQPPLALKSSDGLTTSNFARLNLLLSNDLRGLSWATAILSLLRSSNYEASRPVSTYSARFNSDYYAVVLPCSPENENDQSQKHASRSGSRRRRCIWFHPYFFKHRARGCRPEGCAQTNHFLPAESGI